MSKIFSKAMTAAFFITVCCLLFFEKAEAKSSITVLIDPGHGGPEDSDADLGAVYGGIQEKDINLITAEALKAELESYGNIKVFLSRKSDEEVSLKNRIAYARKIGADYVISIHYNASERHIFYGSEIFVPSGKLYTKGRALAECIMKKWTDAGMTDKGIKTRIGKSGDYYGLIRQGASVNIPTIILEHGYMDNIHDSVNLDEESEWKKMGTLDATGIAEYFGLKKGEKVNSVEPTVVVEQPAGTVKDDTSRPSLAIRINSYNKSTGEIKYTLYGYEPDSRLYLYGLSTTLTEDENGNQVPQTEDMILFGDTNSVKGKYKVPKGYSGPVYAVVYNNFNMASNTVTAYIGR